MPTIDEIVALEEEEYALTEELLLLLLLDISGLSDSVKKELIAFYHKYGKNGVVTYKEARKWTSVTDHRKRMMVLFLSVSESFDKSFVTIERKLEQHLKDIIKNEIKFFGLKEDDFDFDKILDKAWGLDELTWRDRLHNDRDLWNAEIINDFKVAFLQKQNVEQVITKTDKRFKSIERRLIPLVNTETTAMESIARYEIFRQMGIEQYMFVTERDDRVCEICLPMNSLIFPMSAFEVGITAPPLHPRCRCNVAPVE